MAPQRATYAFVSSLAKLHYPTEPPSRALGSSAMTHTAYVYRTDSGRSPEYVGKVELEAALQSESLNSYIHRRERHVIYVDRVEPSGWTLDDETIPTVYGRRPEGPKPPEPLRKLEPRRR